MERFYIPPATARLGLLLQLKRLPGAPLMRPAALRGRDTTVSQHGGGMRAGVTVADTLDTNKGEGRCLAVNIHLICPKCIKFELVKSNTRNVTSFGSSEKLKPGPDLLVREPSFLARRGLWQSRKRGELTGIVLGRQNIRPGLSRRGLDGPIRTHDSPVLRGPTKPLQTVLNSRVGSHSRANEVRRERSEALCAVVARRRAVEKDFDPRAGPTPEVLENRHQFQFIVGRIKAQTNLWNQVMAVDQVWHRPILTSRGRPASLAQARPHEDGTCAASSKSSRGGHNLEARRSLQVLLNRA